MKKLIIIVLCILSFSCTQNQLRQLYFLEGEWRVDGKNTYEVWERVSKDELQGYVYKIKDGHKLITETTSIKSENNAVVYRATVLDQNDGATVSFVLNESVDSCFSFENREHDFPKKIQYKRITDHQLKIQVSGANDKGYSFLQTRQ